MSKTVMITPADRLEDRAAEISRLIGNADAVLALVGDALPAPEAFKLHAALDAARGQLETATDLLGQLGRGPLRGERVEDGATSPRAGFPDLGGAA